MMDHKICSSCKEKKPFSNYDKHKLGKFGLNPVCKSCRLTKQRVSRKENGYTATLKYRYGITYADYCNRLVLQNNKCLICKTELDEATLGSKSPCVDHNHSTGEVRGILCRNCNTAIGHAKEDVTILKAMIEYLS